MNEDRRRFLFQLQGLAGAGLLPDLASAQQTVTDAGPDPKLLKYWISRGIPAASLPAPGAAAGASDSKGPWLGGVDPDLMLLYVDPDKKELFLPYQLPQDRIDAMIAGTDAQVQIGIGRIRLSTADHQAFESYNSGGLLFDVTQGTSPKTQTPVDPATLAWSVFSAIFPGARPAGGASPPTASASSGAKSSKSTGKSTQQAQASGSVGGKTSPADSLAGGALSGLKGSGTSSPTLQPLEQVHTMQLPGGLGHTNLTVFMKDRKKSRFGVLLDLFVSAATGSASSYLSLLNLGGIAQPAMASLNQLVANLHLKDDQKLLFQNSDPIDLVACRDKAAKGSTAVHLVPGTYVALRKEQLKLLRGKTTNVQLFDGYLMESSDDFTTYYDQAREFTSGLSYVSLQVTVKANKLGGGGCKLPQA